MPPRIPGPFGRPVGTMPVWLAFALAVVLATKPVWSFWLFGFDPTLEDLLSLRCLSP